MVDSQTFTKLATSLPEVIEEPHFEKTSFRVGGKIFVTLNSDKHEAVFKFSPDMQALIMDESDTFFSVGAWSKHGWAGVRLEMISESDAASYLRTAWQAVAPKKLHNLLA